MQRFIAVRVLQSLLAIWVMSIIVFGLARVSGNPLDVMLPIEAGPEDYERVEKHWGLDKPLHTQYVIFITKALQGDFGELLEVPGPVRHGPGVERLPATLELAGFALLISVVIAAAHRGPGRGHERHATGTRREDHRAPRPVAARLLAGHRADVDLRRDARLASRPRAGAGSSTSSCPPSPSAGSRSPPSCGSSRSSMLEVLDSEFVKLARIKGLPEWKVVWKHCLRNAAIAPLTFFAIIAGVAADRLRGDRERLHLAGQGLLVVDAVRSRDFQVVQAVVIVFAGIFIL